MIIPGDDDILIVLYSYCPELPRGRYLGADPVRELG